MKNVFLIFLALFVLIQFIPSNIQNPKTDKSLQIQAPQKVMDILKKACYDCHSNEVNIPWYASIAPFSFYIKNHVDLGRKYVNFSVWENYTQDEKDKILKETFRTVYAAMPLPSYILLHKEAKLTKEEIKIIRDWTDKAPF